MENRLVRIEKAIARNREALQKGGDVRYYTAQILRLNALAAKIDAAN